MNPICFGSPASKLMKVLLTPRVSIITSEICTIMPRYFNFLNTHLLSKIYYFFFKGDSQLKAITIVGPSSGVTYDPGAGNLNPLCNYNMDSVVDWGTFIFILVYI